MQVLSLPTVQSQPDYSPDQQSEPAARSGVEHLQDTACEIKMIPTYSDMLKHHAGEQLERSSVVTYH